MRQRFGLLSGVSLLPSVDLVCLDDSVVPLLLIAPQDADVDDRDYSLVVIVHQDRSNY